jgi:hypothetical protein
MKHVTLMTHTQLRKSVCVLLFFVCEGARLEHEPSFWPLFLQHLTMLDDIACIAGFPAAAALAFEILQSFKGDSEMPLEQFLQQMRSTGPCNNACMCDQTWAECATIQTS